MMYERQHQLYQQASRSIEGRRNHYINTNINENNNTIKNIKDLKKSSSRSSSSSSSSSNNNNNNNNQDEDQRLEIIDLSGMSLHKLPHPSINLAAICKLDLSNNNLEVFILLSFFNYLFN